MKVLARIIVLICLFLGNCVSAEPFKVLVLPVDLFSVCENYYCFPEVSEIFAQDVISNFNKSGGILSPDLYTVRKKLTSNQTLQSSVKVVLDKYKSSNTVDFAALKAVSKEFDAKSVLLISADVVQNSNKRNVWDVLEVTSVFEGINLFTMEVSAVLTDNVNDVVMWSGKYKRTLGDNEERFWAENTAQAASQLEKIRFFSKDIVSKNISQNIILRFYPKVTKPVIEQTPAKEPAVLQNPEGNIKPQKEDYGEIQSETIYNF